MSPFLEKFLNFLKDVKLLYVAISIIFVSGIINYVIEGTTLSPTMVYARSLRYQSLIETVIYLFVTLLGIGGVFLLLKIENQRMKRVATLYFALGIIILLIASILPFWIWRLKLY